MAFIGSNQARKALRQGVRMTKQMQGVDYEDEQLKLIADVINQYADKYGYYVTGFSTSESVARMLRHVEGENMTAVAQMKAFNEDVIAYLRAVALMINTAINGGTHHIKEIRINGVIELIEGVINDLRSRRDEFGQRWQRQYPDIFRSNAVDHYWKNRAKNAETELERLKGTTQPDTDADQSPSF